MKVSSSKDIKLKIDVIDNKRKIDCKNPPLRNCNQMIANENDITKRSNSQMYLTRGDMANKDLTQNNSVNKSMLKGCHKKNVSIENHTAIGSECLNYSKTLGNILAYKKQYFKEKNRSNVHLAFNNLSDKLKHSQNINTDKNSSTKEINFLNKNLTINQSSSSIPKISDHQPSLSEIKKKLIPENFYNISENRNTQPFGKKFNLQNFRKETNMMGQTSKKFLCYIKDNERFTKKSVSKECFNEFDMLLKKSRQSMLLTKKNLNLEQSDPKKYTNIGNV